MLQTFEALVERDAGELSATWTPRGRPNPTDSAFEHFVSTTNEQSARPLFATLPLGAADAPRLV